MDKITKSMCSQLRDNYYNPELIMEASAIAPQPNGETSGGQPQTIAQKTGGDSESESNKETYTEKDEVWQTFKKGVREQIQTVSASFHELDYYPMTQKVQWSGTIANGIAWSTYFGNDGKGFFITAENVAMTPEDTKALLKLSLYFDTKWAEAIQQAIDNKDFANKKD